MLQNNGSDNNNDEKAFCFLSQMLGKKVYCKDGRLMGTFRDVLATLHDRRPQIEGFVLSKGGIRTCYSIKDMDCLSLARSRGLSIDRDRLEPFEPGEHQVSVERVLYDRQIVDLSGAKVERVNDVRILFCNGRVLIAQVDVGFTGLMRRLGFERAFRWVAGALGRKLRDELIDWKFVQPMPETLTSPIGVALRHEQIRQLHAGELADIIEDLDRDERITLVQSIGAQDAADALEEANINVQTSILREIDTELAADILEEMEPAIAADVVEKLPSDAKESILAAMEAEDRDQIELLVQAEAETAASLMTVDFLACPETYTAGMALDLLRHSANDIESITYIYCLDEGKRLSGVTSLRELILSEPGTPLHRIMNPRLATLKPDEDLESVAELFLKLRFKALPVIDRDGYMQGIVTLMHSIDELVPHYHRLLKAS